MIDQPLGGARQIVAAEALRRVAQGAQKAAQRDRPVTEVAELIADRLRADGVQGGHRCGQDLGKPARLAHSSGDGAGAAQSREQRRAGRPVHHHEGPAKAAAWSSGEADRRCREPARCHGRLHDRLPAGDVRHRHDPRHQLARPSRRRFGQGEGQQLRGETSG